MSWIYYAGRLVGRALLTLLARCQVRGRPNVPPAGGLLVVANHLSIADIPLLGVKLGRPAIFMAKEEIFHPRPLGYLVRNLGAFPVSRGQADLAALRQSVAVLRQGLALIVFPEGTRSRNAQLQPAYAGAALIALKSGVPVLPIGIFGTESIHGFGWLFRRPLVTVNIGRPFLLPGVNHRVVREQLAGATDSIMQRIAELLPPPYRGVYAAREAVPYAH